MSILLFGILILSEQNLNRYGKEKKLFIQLA